MFFVLSKVFWLVAQPLSLVLGSTLIGLVLLLLHRRRSAIAAFGASAALLFLVAYTSLGYVLIQPLEHRFAVPAQPPATVSAIILLGGATMARPSTARGIAELNQAGDRLATTFMLSERYPEAQIVLSGGSGMLVGDTESESETMQRFLVGLGVSPDRLMLEGESRNTAENARYTGDMLGAEAGAILLVTSAFHMPRSVGIFRQEGIEIVPWPTDYRSAGNQGFELDIANPNQNLETATVAMREWIGLVAYSLTGRTSEFLPAP